MFRGLQDRLKGIGASTFSGPIRFIGVPPLLIAIRHFAVLELQPHAQRKLDLIGAVLCDLRQGAACPGRDRTTCGLRAIELDTAILETPFHRNADHRWPE